MAFWSSWFAPACDGCGTKIVGAEPVARDGKKFCAACETARVEAEAKKAAEVEARRKAEEEARARFEQGKSFGVDPRTKR